LWESLTTRLSLLWADPISLLFAIALLSLLLHIHSREYYRYWFTGR